MIEKKQGAFRVSVNVTIEKRDPNGYNNGERLTTSEEMFLSLTSFTDIAAVLGQFHDLAEKIRKTEDEI